MTEHLAAYVADIPKGEAIQSILTEADGTEAPVAVFHMDDGAIYAIGDVCTHGEVSLSEGEIEGCEVECWAHGGRFDVRTGVATELPAIQPVKAYPVRIDGERVLVDVDNPIVSTKENA